MTTCMLFVIAFLLACIADELMRISKDMEQMASQGSERKGGQEG